MTTVQETTEHNEEVENHQMHQCGNIASELSFDKHNNTQSQSAWFVVGFATKSCLEHSDLLGSIEDAQGLQMLIGHRKAAFNSRIPLSRSRCDC